MSTSPRPYRLRILIVETDPSTRDSLAVLLADLGHWVESVPDEATALDRSRQDGFDVLLTSIWQPEPDTIGLLGELALQSRLPERVVAMGAQSLEEVGPSSQKIGCHAYLPRPFSLEQLVAVLR